MPTVAKALLMFHPQSWGQVEHFRNFFEGTHQFNKRDRRALNGIIAHFEKAIRLRRLAERLQTNLGKDEAELEVSGYTPAENAKEVATIIEAAILELYSSIDCTVKVLKAIYGAETRGFKDSTRSTFQGVDKLSGAFPEEFKVVIREATWFGRLLRLRDELTHLDTGSVHTDRKTNTINYHHFGMTENDKPLIIEDIFTWLSTTETEINSFLGAIFRYLNEKLIDKPVFQICGMVEGRALHRYVSPIGELTFNSGSCGAWTWFEKAENPSCPFTDECGAYLRKVHPPDHSI